MIKWTHGQSERPPPSLRQKNKRMSIKPIKTEQDYALALQEIESLFGIPIGSEDSDRLEVLVTLVQAYEAKHHPIGPPDPIAAIEYEMEKRGLSRKDLEEVIGSSGRVSEVLNRQRPLTASMIKRLYRAYRISPEILLADYPVNNPGRLKKSAKKPAKAPQAEEKAASFG